MNRKLLSARSRRHFLLICCAVLSLALTAKPAAAGEILFDDGEFIFSDSLGKGDGKALQSAQEGPVLNKCIKGCCEDNGCKYEFDPDLLGNTCGTDLAFPTCAFNDFVKCRDNCDNPIVTMGAVAPN